MFTHVMVGTNDIPKAKTFYDAIFAALGGGPGHPAGDRVFYQHKGGAFAVGKPANGEPAQPANGGTIGLAADNRDQVDAWHAAGMAAGGRDEGAPGKRDMPGRELYGAYLRDPDGNKLCAFHEQKG